MYLHKIVILKALGSVLGTVNHLAESLVLISRSFELVRIRPAIQRDFACDRRTEHSAGEETHQVRREQDYRTTETA